MDRVIAKQRDRIKKTSFERLRVRLQQTRWPINIMCSMERDQRNYT